MASVGRHWGKAVDRLPIIVVPIVLFPSRDATRELLVGRGEFGGNGQITFKREHFSDLELQSELWFGVGHLIVSRMLRSFGRWVLFSSHPICT